MAGYSAAVERWDSLLRKYFADEDVEKAKWVIYHESGGDPTIKSSGSEQSWGLFQHNIGNGLGTGFTPEHLQDPEANIAIAAGAVYGGSGWAPWGEGAVYQGKPFGALGNFPYQGGSGIDTRPAMRTGPQQEGRTGPMTHEAGHPPTLAELAGGGPAGPSSEIEVTWRDLEPGGFTWSPKNEKSGVTGPSSIWIAPDGKTEMTETAAIATLKAAKNNARTSALTPPGVPGSRYLPDGTYQEWSNGQWVTDPAGFNPTKAAGYRAPTAGDTTPFQFSNVPGVGFVAAHGGTGATEVRYPSAQQAVSPDTRATIDAANQRQADLLAAQAAENVASIAQKDRELAFLQLQHKANESIKNREALANIAAQIQQNQYQRSQLVLQQGQIAENARQFQLSQQQQVNRDLSEAAKMPGDVGKNAALLLAMSRGNYSPLSSAIGAGESAITDASLGPIALMLKNKDALSQPVAGPQLPPEDPRLSSLLDAFIASLSGAQGITGLPQPGVPPISGSAGAAAPGIPSPGAAPGILNQNGVPYEGGTFEGKPVQLGTPAATLENLLSGKFLPGPGGAGFGVGQGQGGAPNPDLALAQKLMELGKLINTGSLNGSQQFVTPPQAPALAAGLQQLGSQGAQTTLTQAQPNVPQAGNFGPAANPYVNQTGNFNPQTGPALGSFGFDNAALGLTADKFGPQFAQGTGFINAPDQWISGDAQQAGVPNPEHMQLFDPTNDAQLRVTPMPAFAYGTPYDPEEWGDFGAPSPAEQQRRPGVQPMQTGIQPAPISGPPQSGTSALTSGASGGAPQNDYLARAREFLSTAGQNALKGGPFTEAPTPIGVSAPGTSNYLQQYAAALAATMRGIDPALFLEEARRNTPIGLPVGTSVSRTR